MGGSSPAKRCASIDLPVPDQQRMTTGGGDLQRAPGGRLALHVGQVGIGRRRATRGRGHAGKAVGRQRVGRHGAFRQKAGHHVQQMARAVHAQAGHQRGFFGAAGRQHQLRVDARLLQRHRHGQRAAHRAQLARQRQLAGKFPPGQPRAVDLAAGRQDAQRNRQVEAARILGQIGRRQVDGDALVVRKRQPAVLQRAAHALARFLHFHVGQAHQREAGQAVGQMHLYRHGGRGQPHQGAALHQTQTHRGRFPSCGAPRAERRVRCECNAVYAAASCTTLRAPRPARSLFWCTARVRPGLALHRLRASSPCGRMAGRRGPLRCAGTFPACLWFKCSIQKERK